MSATNRITVADFSGGGRKTTTAEIYQYAQGQVLQFEGLELPDSYRVDFSNERERDYSKPQVGDADGVTIPDEYFLSGKPVYVFIVLSDTEEDCATEYQVHIPVRRRPKPTNYAPTEVQKSIIDQTIAAAQNAKEKAEAAAEMAEDAAEEADGRAEDAAADALKAEGYALGTQDGEPVDSDSPYYHNNAAYHAGEAGHEAEVAGAAAVLSASYAEGGTGTRPGEDTDNAKHYKEQTEAAAAQALKDIGDAKTEAVSEVTGEGTVQKNAVTAEGTAQVSRVETAGSGQVSAVNQAGTTQVGNVNSAGNSNVAAVNAAGTAKVQAVQAEGATQVQAVKDEGATQIALAEAEAEKSAESAEDAEAWAVGQRGGVDVPSTDPAYHNNAKYIAEHIYVTLGVDDFFSETSENPQQNKFVTPYLLVYDEEDNKTYAVKRSVVNGYLVETYEEVSV